MKRIIWLSKLFKSIDNKFTFSQIKTNLLTFFKIQRFVTISYDFIIIKWIFNLIWFNLFFVFSTTFDQLKYLSSFYRFKKNKITFYEVKEKLWYWQQIFIIDSSNLFKSVFIEISFKTTYLTTVFFVRNSGFVIFSY